MFKVGQYIVRKNPASKSYWMTACEKRGLDPYGPMLVTGMMGPDPVIGAINKGSWWGTMFDLAPPPEKDLEDYM